MKHTEMISRRSFLQAAALTAACSALALTGCGSSSSAASSAAGAASAQEGAAVYKVGIVNYVDDASLNQIVASLEARLDEVGAERGVTFNYADYYANAQADQSNLNQIGADLVADEVDVIVAVANPLRLHHAGRRGGHRHPGHLLGGHRPGGRGLRRPAQHHRAPPTR